MNYTLDFNQLNQIEMPQIILCNRNKRRYGELYPVQDLRITMNANSFHELSFKIPKEVNGQVNPYWDNIVDLKTIYLEKFGYFQIEVDRNNNGIVEYKCITAQSLEVELGQLYLNDFEINSGDIEDEDYVESTVFYNPLDPKRSLLHKALLKAPAWSIAHVDAELWNKQRSFDTDKTTIYDFFMNTVAEELKCTFQYDTFNRSISVYLVENYGQDTTLYFSHENLIHELNIKSEASSIKNCFRILGGDGVYINEINPNGTDTIWCLNDEDKKDMSKELVSKLDSYDNLYASYMEEYEQIVLEWQAQNVIINDLEHKAPEDLDSVNWTTYSMVYLKIKEKAYQNVEDTYKDRGFSATNVSEYNSLYLPNHELLLEVQAEIMVRQASIDLETQKKKDIEDRKKTVQDALKLEDYLGTDLWLELSLYRREEIYENTNYSITEITTDDERIEMTRELYDEGVEELRKASNPQYEFSTTMNNILAHPKFREHAKDFALWNYIRVGLNDDQEIIKVRIVSFSIDFEDLSDIQVDFSDMTEVGNAATQGRDAIQKAQGAATSYNTVKRQYDKAKNSIDLVEELRQNGLTGDVLDIKNSTSADILINDRGILCRKWNPEKQDYELEQMHIINNKIVMTDDNWNSGRMAIGKINFNGENLYGVNADLLMGNLLISKNLHVQNTNNSFIVDEDGAALRDASLTITNGINTLKMSPNADSVFEILKGTERKIWMDADGNANFSGLITGGTINIGDGAFTVLSDGNCNITKGSLNIGGKFSVTQGGIMSCTDAHMANAYVTGTINGANIYGSTIQGGTINGAVVTSTGIVDGYECTVKIENGNALLSGRNAYVRFSNNGSSNYSKGIGISKDGNLVIGHDSSVSSAYGGSQFGKINIYGQNCNFRLSGDENLISINMANRSISANTFATDYIQLSGGVISAPGGSLYIGQNTVRANTMQVIENDTAKALATKEYVDSKYNTAYNSGYSAGYSAGSSIKS